MSTVYCVRMLTSITLAGWFVHRLREAASACPNVTLRQGTVKRLLNGEAAVVLWLQCAQAAQASVLSSISKTKPQAKFAVKC